MGNTYYKIWIHLVWATKYRFPFLSANIREKIFQHIREEAIKKDYHLDFINGIEDHLHCLISLNPKYSISQVVNDLKGESSHWINSENLLKDKFAWQRGFGAFSVSESGVAAVRKYILRQPEHHKHITFKEELELLRQEYNAIIIED